MVLIVVRQRGLGRDNAGTVSGSTSRMLSEKCGAWRCGAIAYRDVSMESNSGEEPEKGRIVNSPSHQL
jgi:hypothetical protein